MELSERVDAFVRLGSVMQQAVAGKAGRHSDGLISLIHQHHKTNPWFTPESVTMALKAFGEVLTYSRLNRWTSMYPKLKTHTISRKIGVVMAGNIPMVGFHDMLSVLITGHTIIVKASTKDDRLIRELSSILVSLEPAFERMIDFSEIATERVDGVIATGSDNTSRYFEYNFSEYPRLIRRNRTGIAHITGEETTEQLRLLGSDVFTYFGLGCRNVTKLYVPDGFNFDNFRNIWKEFSCVLDNKKYANNYYYNKAVSKINHQTFADTGFIIFREDASLFPPVGVINYEYVAAEKFADTTKYLDDKIQVIVSGDKYAQFGTAQKPNLWDYSDGSDTIDFLLKII